MSLYNVLKPLFFSLDPERVHDWSLKQFSKYPEIYKKIFSGINQSEEFKVHSNFLHWKTPIGLAAGFDKNAVALDFLSSLGFGNIEVGTVTLKPQRGNPKPRIFRYREIESLRNSMGFPGLGAEFVREQLKKYQGDCCIGANIGKNKDTALEDAAGEYAQVYEMLAPHAQYVAINVSSPNTQDLRKLQDRHYLEEIFSEVNKKRKEHSKALFVKISPDLDLQKIMDVIALCEKHNLQGIIATNTTADHEFGVGGLSGKYLFDKSKKVRELLLKELNLKKFDFIAVGGLSKPEQFEEYWKAGGKLAQVYTSFVFQGPKLIRDILLRYSLTVPSRLELC